MAKLSALLNKKIVIVGLGQEGLALATYLLKHGLTVTATDINPADQFEAANKATLEKLTQQGLSVVLGDHPVSLLDEADILFVSPGVPLELPFLKEARNRKIPLSTETRLFCYLCPAKILAITGSSGKSTTSTLLSRIIEASGQKTWFGGNIGRPLIEVVDDITPNDLVVMELSSFQLEYFRDRMNKHVEAGDLAPLLQGWSPPVSALLNITPNHLDRHHTMRSYVQAKRAIVDYQQPDGVSIMSLDDDVTRTIGRQFGSKVRWFSTEAERPMGACLYQDQISLLDEAGHHEAVINKSQLNLRGEHNLSNVMAACLMAREIGVSIATMQEVIAEFIGLPYRLEFVREYKQVTYFNDSVATSPDRVIAALRAFDRPVTLLAGGRDKKLSWEEAARVMVHKTNQVILFGEAKDMIAEVVERAKQSHSTTKTSVHLCVNLADAVNLASQIATPGSVVLLSPGCTSYDQFRNFAERGNQFNELVRQLSD